MAFFSKLMRSSRPRDPRYGGQPHNFQYPQDPAAYQEPGLPTEDSEFEPTIVVEGDESPFSAPPAEAPVTQGRRSSDAVVTGEEYNELAGERNLGRRATDQIRPLVQKILSGSSITGILSSLTRDLINIFQCQSVQIYAVDLARRQLVSITHALEEEKEFRLDISPKSLAGFCAATGKTVNVADVTSTKELKKIHADLKHDQTWEKQAKIRIESMLVTALPFEKRLMGVLEVINKTKDAHFSEADVRQAKELSTTLGHALVKLEIEQIEEQTRAVAHAIHSAKNIDEILAELKPSIQEIFDAGMLTIYSLDEKKNEIFSKVKSENSIKEIRLPISAKSIAGCVALEKRPINLADVNNKAELQNYKKELQFDGSWDKKSGLKTKSMLAYPLIHLNKVMGVLQVANKTTTDRFSSFDERNAKIIGDTLALAVYNQWKAQQKKRTKFGYLVEKGIVSQDELNAGIAKARMKRVDVEDILLAEMKLKRSDIGKSLEAYYDIPYTGYSESVVLPSHVFAGLNKNYLAKNNWVPLQNTPTHALILIDDPANQDKIASIKMIFPKKSVEFQVGLKADIRDFLNSNLSSDEPAHEEAHEEPAHTEEVSSLLNALVDERQDDVIDLGVTSDDAVTAISETDSTIVRLVNKILTDAYDQGVSDIHLEPGTGKKDVKVRFRKDGSCRVYQQIPFMYKQAIISRIKIMSRLDIAEKRMPQDGKIKMRYGKKEIEFRVATCPTVGGNEDAVLRILSSSKPIPLAEMGFLDQNLKVIGEMIAKPYGLILVVGPTGSGKTTTLHSCLGQINSDERKIWTAEDPVEITQEGLRQVQMQDKIGLNFARAMRSFLRGDPDVIMVGEMRDTETASIGLEASLTGHLVFSTLHTNSAPETITRLLDMGMNPLNFSDALLLIVAQRLLKTLCKKCKEPYNPSKEEFEILAKEYGVKEFQKLGIKYSKDLKLFQPKGCSACGDTGYAGRMGIHEVLSGTDEMKRMIMRSAMVDEIRKRAIEDGMFTLKQDGIQKIFQGHCDIKQVQAVCVV